MVDIFFSFFKMKISVVISLFGLVFFCQLPEISSSSGGHHIMIGGKSTHCRGELCDKLYAKQKQKQSSLDQNDVKEAEIEVVREAEMKADWCSLNCKSGKVQNIGCKEKGQCLNVTEPCKFVEVDVTLILNIHNQLRNRFALGIDPNTKDLFAADMLMMEWDDDLAFLAACNLKSCPAGMTQDYCHITKKFDTAGQNIAWSKGNSDCIRQSAAFVAGWYDEMKLVGKDDIKKLGNKFAFTHSGAGHFTQIIWSQSTQLGCALISKKDENGDECMMTCNYAPAGNVMGERMFREGEPTTKCPKGRIAHGVLRGLCAKGSTTTIRTTIGLIFVPLVLLIVYK